MGQELLTTFDTLIGEFVLIPGTAAVFKVKVNDGMAGKNIDTENIQYHIEDLWWLHRGHMGS